MNTVPWWQRGIIYQIYPRSFQDANGDGVGDLPGILRRLDYLAWLGVDAIWLSPIYPSPMADFGYDVSNYTDVHPLFGTMDDFDALLEAAHARGIRVILDLVPNHTSDQHPWFLESRSSRHNSKRDWYIWRDPAPDGGPPNNWLSLFGGPAWTYDEQTGQYYLHSFLAQQPDLNWHNPEVREAIFNVMRFWLDKGVDGFRVDVADRFIKDPCLRNNPRNPDWREGMLPVEQFLEAYNKNYADNHLTARWLRAVADEYDDRVLIGEIYLPIPELVTYYGTPEAPEYHIPYNFTLITTPWEAEAVRCVVDLFEGRVPSWAWPNWVLGNHDRSRVASRVGREQARVAMMLLLTLRGTPTIYYGDELGMEDVPIPPDRVQDPLEKNIPGMGLGRDPERTPMQWDTSPNAGFCPPDVEPWLPLSEAYHTVNVAVQREQPNSMLNMTRTLIHLRRSSKALAVGDYFPCETPAGVFAYTREAGAERYLIALNFTGEPQAWTLPPAWKHAHPVLSTFMDRPEAVQCGTIHLRPNEGLILERRQHNS